jgi:hypothetical protein
MTSHERRKTVAFERKSDASASQMRRNCDA